MSKQKSWKSLFLGGAAATAVVAGLAAFTLAPSSVSAQDVPADAPAAEESGRRFGRGGHGGPGGIMDRGMKGEHAEYLADALDISVEELESAQDAAKAAGLAQAVEEGIITQEEADQIAAGEGRGKRGFHKRGRFDPQNDTINRDALLADALGITIDELDAAKDSAREAALADAIEQGDITEEQAERMQAMHALRDTIDHEAILAGVLDVTVEELQTAHEEGTVRELFENLNLDREAIHEAMQAGFEQAVEQAVADGVITQEQADLLQDGEGFGGRGFFSDRDGQRGGRDGGQRGGPDGGQQDGNDGESSGPRGQRSQSQA